MRAMLNSWSRTLTKNKFQWDAEHVFDWEQRGDLRVHRRAVIGARNRTAVNWCLLTKSFDTRSTVFRIIGRTFSRVLGVHDGYRVYRKGIKLFNDRQRTSWWHVLVTVLGVPVCCFSFLFFVLTSEERGRASRAFGCLCRHQVSKSTPIVSNTTV